MNNYDAGDSVRMDVLFTDAGGTPADPTLVVLNIVPPPQRFAGVPGTVQYTYASGSITKASVGSYYYDMIPVPSGTYGFWTYYFSGSGDVNAVFQGAFGVRQGVTP